MPTGLRQEESLARYQAFTDGLLATMLAPAARPDALPCIPPQRSMELLIQLTNYLNRELAAQGSRPAAIEHDGEDAASDAFFSLPTWSITVNRRFMAPPPPDGNGVPLTGPRTRELARILLHEARHLQQFTYMAMYLCAAHPKASDRKIQDMLTIIDADEHRFPLGIVTDARRHVTDVPAEVLAEGKEFYQSTFGPAKKKYGRKPPKPQQRAASWDALNLHGGHAATAGVFAAREHLLATELAVWQFNHVPPQEAPEAPDLRRSPEHYRAPLRTAHEDVQLAYQTGVPQTQCLAAYRSYLLLLQASARHQYASAAQNYTVSALEGDAHATETSLAELFHDSTGMQISPAGAVHPRVWTEADLMGPPAAPAQPQPQPQTLPPAQVDPADLTVSVRNGEPAEDTGQLDPAPPVTSPRRLSLRPPSPPRPKPTDALPQRPAPDERAIRDTPSLPGMG